MILIDKYYKSPIIYDYTISLIILYGLSLLIDQGFIDMPCSSKISSIATGVGAIGLTISGFILTLISILITLKASQIFSEQELTNESSPFKIFLASNMYDKAVDIMKYAVYSLVFISLILYLFELIISKNHIEILFYFDILGLIIILTTFIRSFYVVGMILKMQKN